VSRGVTLALGLLLGASACSGRDDEAKASAARLSHAIAIVRDAPNDAKAGPLGELTKLPCAGPEVCETRDACVAAYTLHVDAVGLTGAARMKVIDGQSAEAASLLVAAQQKLASGSAQVEDCVRREGALRVRYKL
jgi:hypothetical protein